MPHIKSDGSALLTINPELSQRMIVAIFISLICHIFCFNGIELTFDKKVSGRSSEISKVFFLGPILKESDCHSGSIKDLDSYASNIDMLTPLERNVFIRRDFLRELGAKSSLIYKLGSNFKKPLLDNLIDNKIAYIESLLTPETKKAESIITFYPPMPYHFLLYFKDRQTAHMEVVFYISTKGKVLGLKRKISSGNPEVDLLIMRNLNHFLNLCKSNFALGSWQTVKIDLSP